MRKEPRELARGLLEQRPREIDRLAEMIERFFFAREDESLACERDSWSRKEEFCSGCYYAKLSSHAMLSPFLASLKYSSYLSALALKHHS